MRLRACAVDRTAESEMQGLRLKPRAGTFFFLTFYFAIMIDLQEVTRRVQGGPVYPSPASLHANILHN